LKFVRRDEKQRCRAYGAGWETSATEAGGFAGGLETCFAKGL